MEKYLITGFSGFVSRYFLEYLENNSIRAHVLGVDVLSPQFSLEAYANVQCAFEKIDLLDKTRVDNLIYQFQPDYVLHLASFSSVAFSWKQPVTSFLNNNNIFLNLLEKVRALNLKCRILSVGSSEEYGNVDEADLPLTEEHRLNPLSPYAVARVSQEMLSRVYVDGYGLDIVMTRSFNHIGPRQREIFAVPSFVRQLVQMKKMGAREVELRTGDVNVVRDFLDVRDVVAAYYLLLKNGTSGQVYNICGENGVSLRNIINNIARCLDLQVKISIEEKLLRPNDAKVVIGSSAKLREQTGWTAVIPLEQSLRDMIAYWESQN